MDDSILSRIVFPSVRVRVNGIFALGFSLMFRRVNIVISGDCGWSFRTLDVEPVNTVPSILRVRRAGVIRFVVLKALALIVKTSHRRTIIGAWDSIT